MNAPNMHSPKKKYAPLKRQKANAYPFNALKATDTMTLGTVIFMELKKPGFKPRFRNCEGSSKTI